MLLFLLGICSSLACVISLTKGGALMLSLLRPEHFTDVWHDETSNKPYSIRVMKTPLAPGFELAQLLGWFHDETACLLCIWCRNP